MPYSIRQYENGNVELRRNGAVELTIDATINPRLAGHLCTPNFHDVRVAAQQGPGFVQYTNCLSDSGGKWVIDAVTRRLQCASASLDEVVKGDEDRDEILAGINAVKALFPGRDDAWAKAYLKFHRQFDLFNAG